MKSFARFAFVLVCLTLVACGGANTNLFNRSSNWRDGIYGDTCNKRLVTPEAYDECMEHQIHAALDALKNNPGAKTAKKDEETKKQGSVLPATPVLANANGVFIPTGSMTKCKLPVDMMVVYTNDVADHWIEVNAGMREVPFQCDAYDVMVKIPVLENGAIRLANTIPPGASVVFTKVVEAGGLNKHQTRVTAYVQARPGLWVEHGLTNQTIHPYCFECRENESAHWTFRRSDFRASLAR